jgi:hypothetical protein
MHIDAIDEAGLAGTIRAYNREDNASLYGQTNVIEHLDASEREVQLIYI